MPGLGVCLSDLVAVPNPTSPTPLPLPTLTTPSVKSTGGTLAWWEILLMTLGCAFIFVGILWLWRRRARKQRAKQTAVFATKLKHRVVWRLRFDKFTTFFKGNNKSQATSGMFVKETEYQRLQRLRDAEAARHEHEMSKLESNYVKSLKSVPSPQPSIDGANHSDSHSSNRVSAPSLYSQVTGLPRKGPEPKQPLREFDLERGDLLTSRFSSTTSGTSIYRNPAETQPEALPPMPSDAETYASQHRQPTSFWLIPAERLVPTNTGGSKNPFRR